MLARRKRMPSKAQLTVLLALAVTAAVAGTDVGIGIVSRPLPAQASYLGATDPATYLTGLALSVDVPLGSKLTLGLNLSEAGTKCTRMRSNSHSSTATGLVCAGLNTLVLIPLPMEGLALRTGLDLSYVGSSILLADDEYGDDYRTDASGAALSLQSGIRVRMSEKISIRGDIAVPALQWVNTTTTYSGTRTTYSWLNLAGSPPGVSLSVALTL
jgi:hypothetical protein